MNVESPLTMAALAPLLAGVIALAATAAVICCVFRPPQQVTSIKLLGSLMVIALAFAANDPVTYPMSIFILATLMTNLNFLQNLAALFTKDKEYWHQHERRRRRHSSNGGGASPTQVAPGSIPD